MTNNKNKIIHTIQTYLITRRLINRVKNDFILSLKKNINYFLIPNRSLTYTMLHNLLSTEYNQTSLIELVAYENIIFEKFSVNQLEKQMTSFNKNLFFISIYIYFLNKSELFIFDLTSSTQSLSTYKNKFKQNLNSGESLFFNLNWLEREMAELLGMVYRFKNDIRNLLLMYGDIIMPLLKAFPSVGFIEFIYSL
jgi:hypothetical protein